MAERDDKKQQIPAKNAVVLREEEILKFWQDNKIFEQSLEKPSPKGDFIFYDGPPFATGLPHFGHMLPGTIKDVIPRFKTMQGYHVPRRWGWDCHGLPIENLIEKELGLKSKKDIEDLGIETFNEAARASIFRYDADWKKIIPRSGRWVDMDNAYLTVDSTYSESIWWSFKTLHEKGLVYKAFKSMFLCPHCGTTLSNFEVTQGYKDITDLSVYAKFELVDEPGTYLVAWTTTPWTLPGNVALAVNPDIEYAEILITQENKKEKIIVAKDRVAAVSAFIKDGFEVGATVKIGDFVGKKYKPVFDYYKDADLSVGDRSGNKENLYKIVTAHFVTAADGTGIVHIAPAFGEDDYNLSLTEKLPFIQHVSTDGKFKKEVKDFAGMAVKPKDTAEEPNLHQKADIEIIKHLAAQGKLFAKEKLVHSYPHCWRCDTPLLNYATDSWFVEVTKIKDRLVSLNKKVNWLPEEVGEGRFGKWLENARDWAVSRSRYWGAPLPVWICDGCDKREFIGSVSELKEKSKRNTYFLARHGEAQSNVASILNGKFDAPNDLTDNGKKQSKAVGKTLAKKKIDLIISSDFVRTKETAEIIAAEIGISASEIIFDPRLREYGFGTFDGENRDKWHEYWKDRGYSSPSLKVPGGESPEDVRDRTAGFLYEIDARYSGKNILIVSHQDPLCYLQCAANGESILCQPKTWSQYQMNNAETREMNFSALPHNRRYELDLHRPYIDAVSWKCSCGGTFKRVPEVFDTWYESGSMPYASRHYLGTPTKEFNPKSSINFPANFIAEGQDQTRGWFYSLLVLGTGLFDKSPYENVVVNGIVLAEDGQKMSKRLQNYADINDVFNKYGADALRYFLMASPAVKAEDIMFSEKSLDEVLKKLTNRLQNVCSFYEIYKTEGGAEGQKKLPNPLKSKNVLDRWIIARLDDLALEMTTALEAYEIDRAARPIMLFVDDLSTWYLRRSRERFKSEEGADTEADADKRNALATIRFILQEFSKLAAPFMPFLAEDVYGRVKTTEGKESVHLEEWPKARKIDTGILAEMASVRKIVSLALEARAKAGIKVRQPLAELWIKEKSLTDEQALLDVIKDEVNVKQVSVKPSISADIEFDSFIATAELKEEGNVREFTRAIQDLRKKTGFSASDKIILTIQTDDAGTKLVQKFKADIMKTVQALEIKLQNTEGDSVAIDALSFIVALKKVAA